MFHSFREIDFLLSTHLLAIYIRIEAEAEKLDEDGWMDGWMVTASFFLSFLLGCVLL